MELYKAIQNILKYQGEKFILDANMVNALSDFNAFEEHPALKNIYRVLYNDGYIKNVYQQNAWNVDCRKLVAEIERNYCFPQELIEYTLLSISYGLGRASDIPIIKNLSSSTTMPYANSSKSVSPELWAKMSKKEKELALTSLIEIKDDTFLNYKLKLESCSVRIEEGDKISVIYSMSGTLKKFSEYQNFRVKASVMNKNNILCTTEGITYFGNGNRFSGFISDEETFDPRCALDNIGKIIVFFT